MKHIFSTLINKLSFEITRLYSLYFCLRYLPFRQAKLIPILISPKVKITDMALGRIKIMGNARPYQITIGLETGSCGYPKMGHGSVTVKPMGKIIFMGRGIISEGTGLRVDKGTLKIGDEFYCNNNCFIRITQDTNIGSDVIFGWNVVLNTSDGHKVLKSKVPKTDEGTIIIGNHVWVAADVTICKGSVIPDGCIVSQKSLVNKAFTNNNTLLGGIPAKEISPDYNWER